MGLARTHQPGGSIVDQHFGREQLRVVAARHRGRVGAGIVETNDVSRLRAGQCTGFQGPAFGLRKNVGALAQRPGDGLRDVGLRIPAEH